MTVLADLPVPPPTAGIVVFVDDAFAGSPAAAGLVISSNDGWQPIPWATAVGLYLINQTSVGDMRTYLGTPGLSHTHLQSDVSGLITALAGKAAVSHGHVISDTTGLQTALDGKASSTHTHAQSDITGLSTALSGKADTVHTHAQSDITGLGASLAGKSDTGHTHTISNVTGLQSALDAKAALSHNHAIADVTGLQTALDGKASTSGVLVTPTVNATSRTLGSAGFQPSSTSARLFSYTVLTQVTNPLVAGSSTAKVELMCDTNSTPTTIRSTVNAESSVALAVAIAITTANTATLTYLVPAGHYVRLVSTVTGTGATSIISQVEEVL